MRLYKGWFEQTLPAFLEGQRGRAGTELRIAFVHMDCDIYSSTKCVLDCLAPHLGTQHEPLLALCGPELTNVAWCRSRNGGCVRRVVGLRGLGGARSESLARVRGCTS